MRIRRSGVAKAALAAWVIVLASCASGGSLEDLAAAEPSAGPAASAEPPPPPPPIEPRRHGPVVLVTIDGARWQDVLGEDAASLVPTIDRLAREDGAAVDAIRASGPNYVSLPGYTEIFGGRPATACPDNDCARTARPTLLDDAAAAGAKVAAFGSWEKLDRALTSSSAPPFTVSCGRGGAAGEPWPGSGDYRADRYTAALALGYLDRERPDVLYVGLGDTDEYAHHGDREGYLGALRFADSVVASLVARMGDDATLIVTADHGRANDFRGHGKYAPESGRVWLVAAGAAIRARGHATSPRERRLADVAPTVRAIRGMPSEGGALLDELF